MHSENPRGRADLHDLNIDDQKQDVHAAMIEEVTDNEQTIEADWSAKEEAAAKRKIDLVLMPMLFMGFFVYQLDKSNIANALTDTFMEDLNINIDIVNNGNTILFAAIVVCEIPFNLLVQKLGAPIAITCQITTWGLVSTFQAFITNKESFYATRALIGVFEAAYSPGCMLLLAMFYKRDELAVRTTILYVGNYFGAGVGSLVAAGILQMGGLAGLAGWQWLFMLEGILTVLVGVLFILFLPKDPLHTKGMLGPKFSDVFSDRDRHIMHNRVILDDPHKRGKLSDMSLKGVAQQLVNYRLWIHMLINIIGIAPRGMLLTYSPTIIRNLGFSKTASNALNSVSNYGLIILALTLAYFSDRTRKRGLFCLVALAWSTVFAGVQLSLTTQQKKWAKYAILMLVNAANGVIQTLNDAWLSGNAKSPTERSIGLALAVAGSNIGALIGQQLYRAKDAPYFKPAFLAILCLYAGTILVVVGLMLIYRTLNRKADKSRVDGESGTEDAPAQLFRYEW